MGIPSALPPYGAAGVSGKRCRVGKGSQGDFWVIFGNAECASLRKGGGGWAELYRD